MLLASQSKTFLHSRVIADDMQVDVNIYGSDGSEPLRGNHENTDVGKFLREYLDVDVEAVTKELNAKSESFSIESLTYSEEAIQESVSRHYAP